MKMKLNKIILTTHKRTMERGVKSKFSMNKQKLLLIILPINSTKQQKKKMKLKYKKMNKQLMKKELKITVMQFQKLIESRMMKWLK